MADMTDFFDEVGQEFHLHDVIHIKYFLQDSLTEKESEELNLVKNAEDLGKFLVEKHLVENKKSERKFVALLKKIGRNDLAMELEDSLGIDTAAAATPVSKSSIPTSTVTAQEKRYVQTPLEFLVENNSSAKSKNKAKNREQLGYDLLGAVETGNVGMVGQLLSLGISPDAHSSDIFNHTPLHLTVSKDSTEIAHLLITHKADIEARNEYNRTPLHEAACYNRTEIAQLLINHKAYIEARDEDNGTPLHDAAFSNSTEVAQLLIAHNADIEARGKYNNTPLHVAALNNSTEIAQLLINHKADIEARNEDNGTPLHDATFSNSTEIAQLLIAHNADIEARGEYNNTPLHVAALNNSTETAQLLINHKADIEARDEDNRTPLEVARNSFMDTEAVIRLLMEHAANIS